MKTAASEHVLRSDTMVVDAGDVYLSSARLQWLEMLGSGAFWAKMGDFSTFWLISMKPVNAEHVSRAVAMVVGSGDSIDVCDSKTARKNTLFSSPLLGGDCESCDKLALVGSIKGIKKASLGVARLAWACVTSFVCPMIL